MSKENSMQIKWEPLHSEVNGSCLVFEAQTQSAFFWDFDKLGEPYLQSATNTAWRGCSDFGVLTHYAIVQDGFVEFSGYRKVEKHDLPLYK